MQLEMMGIDYSSAPLPLRERFSLTASARDQLTAALRSLCGAEGMVILSTCNRTEVWCSGAKSSLLDGYFSLMELNKEDYLPYFVCRENRAAVTYLLEMTCGMHSQIFGEDQILTQVGEALRSARDHDQTDPVLETLFRTALTAAKRVKTEAPLHQRDHSVPERAITILENTYGALRGKSCLVIGNGEMGRLLCHLLRERGAVVHLTTRRYRHHDTIVPEGCTAVSYDDRYHWIATSDFVFSATISPHCTVKSSLLQPRRVSTPLVLVDLAVPRDMEPELAELPGITLYNMDTLNLEQHCDEASLALARAILQESEDDFYRWQTTRHDVVSIREIGQGMSDMTNRKLTRIYQTQQGAATPEQVAKATAKAMEKLLFDLREEMAEQDWKACVDHLRDTVEHWTEEA